jgi:hypothetical protein
MPIRHSFRFMKPSLTDALAARLEKAKLNFKKDREGALWYAAEDEERLENDFLVPMRDRMFSSSWQLVTCPPAWAERYRQYMIAKGIRFEEELFDDRVAFCIPREYRPHTWRLAPGAPARQKPTNGVARDRAVASRRRAS